MQDDDNEITSEELDGLLDEAMTLNATSPGGRSEVRLYVVAADALRDGAHAGRAPR